MDGRISALAVIAGLAFAGLAFAETRIGRVVAVLDGDTVMLVDSSGSQHRIRLAGIDAPEQSQSFGDRSRAALSGLVFGKDIRAECRLARTGQERCKVWIGSTDINLELVRVGMAWWYPRDTGQNPEDRAAYQQAEFWAKVRRFGLWAEKNPQPPWQWRGER